MPFVAKRIKADAQQSHSSDERVVGDMASQIFDANNLAGANMLYDGFASEWQVAPPVGALQIVHEHIEAGATAAEQQTVW